MVDDEDKHIHNMDEFNSSFQVKEEEDGDEIDHDDKINWGRPIMTKLCS